MELTQTQIAEFRGIVYEYYHKHKRDFPWRHTSDPYCILVSELMLQQTQTERVIEKYNSFIRTFPNITILANASFREVLEIWKGLGYNRRAKWLHEIAKIITEKNKGAIPTEVKELERLPGIGNATARSISAFAFNNPTVFLETNIRTALICHFFKDGHNIEEKSLLEIASQVMDSEQPRKWYSALMDYGSYIKESIGNLSRKSRNYRKQSKFEGSDRQIRGKILEILLQKGSLSIHQIVEKLQNDTKRIEKIIEEMRSEKLLNKDGEILSL